jgi:diguanylate cyclase (GGDEF)-like protein
MNAQREDFAMSTESATILVIDDERESRAQLVQLLASEGYRTTTADNGMKAIAEIFSRPPDLILLDVTMPGMDGFEVASKLKATPATANIPIIMVTAHVGRGARVVALGSGAEEYLTKPVDPAELSLRVRNLLRLRVPAGSPGDIGATSASGDPDAHQFFYDPVTGLPTAAQFREAVNKALAEAPSSGAAVAVMSIDIDNFTLINSSRGVEFGDKLLRLIGTQLVQHAGDRDAVGRLNEDKFGMVLSLRDGANSASASAEQIRTLLRAPVMVDGEEVSTTASVGVALYPQHGVDPEALLQHADTARRVAKRLGGDSSHVHVLS